MPSAADRSTAQPADTATAAVPMRGALHILNPNGSPQVTAGLDEAMAALRAASRVPIVCHTLAGAPPGIQSEHDIAAVALPLLAQACALQDDADAAGFVVACFSDPGLALLREQLRRPVLGIGEAGVLTALTLGQRFGVIAILPASIPRHWRRWGEMGVAGRCAGERALGLSVPELADEAVTFDRLLATGRALRDTDGAQVLVLGCAGLARQRAPLAEALGIPVVDPTQAAAAMALGHIAHATPAAGVAPAFPSAPTSAP